MKLSDLQVSAVSGCVPVVIAFTPNYFIPAITCLSSMLKSETSQAKYHVICLLTEPLPENQVQLLHSLDPHQRMIYSFVQLPTEMEGIYVDARYTIAASFRLLLPELLREYDKVIYTDCDVIIRNDLSELYYTTDLGENYLGAIYESPLEFQRSYVESIGCTWGKYFNSGFLLMNLKKMREDRISERLLDALKVEYLQFPDQDVLNMICKDAILPLAPWYNSIRTFFLPQYKSEFLKIYSLADWDRVQKNGTIHYTGAKPWNAHTVEFNVWWDYYKKLPEQIKESFPVNKKLYLLSVLYDLPFGKSFISLLRTIVRRLK